MAEKKTKTTKKKEPTWDEIGKLVGKKIDTAENEGKFDSCKSWGKGKVQCHASGGFFYFMGFLGALVYYWSTAPNLWEGFLGFFKALFWPGFLVHGLLVFLAASI